jgi:hypothetical protein
MKIKKQVGTILSNEKGMVLPLGLMFLAIIAILGTTAVIVTTTDLKIGSNYRANVQAFYDAEAGVQYALAKIGEGLKADPQTFTLPTTIGSSESLAAYAAPTGFNFTFPSPGVTLTGSNTYTFTSTGSGPGNSQAVIEASFKKKPAINYAAFGDQKTDTKNSGTTLSYDSSDPGAPSTHEADVASNDLLVTHNGASIDGSGIFGEQSDGSATVNGIDAGTTFYGTGGVNVGRIDPDPLGINSGGVYDPSTYSASNDNASAGVGTTINTNGTVILNAGNYYFTDITLQSGATLTINGSVNIFLEGGLSALNGSNINITGKPTDFSIFSNSTAMINFEHNNIFKGLVYAPFAGVYMKNGSSVYGAIWAGSVDIKNSGILYYDTSLKEKYTTNVSLLSWREVL